MNSIIEKNRWRKVPGFSYYEVSDFGRIKSLAREKRGVNTTGKNKEKEIEFFYKTKGGLLKPIILNTGYEQVTLTKENHEQTSVSVHRIVAEAFLPNPENKPQVNHKNGDKRDNRLENLEWATASENTLHGYRELGVVAWTKGRFSENHPTSKAVVQETLSGEFVKKWNCASDAVREHGFDSGHISRCCTGLSKYHKGFKWSYATPHNDK